MMSTETILNVVGSPSEDALARAKRELRDGHLLVVPTDTVYGIGCDAANPRAVTALLAAKGRGKQMPPPVLVSSWQDCERLCVDIPEAARNLAHAFWPGGLTIILCARPDLGWDLGLTGGTLALRMPNQETLLRILSDFGPLAVTSANLTGLPPATTVTQAAAYFGNKVGAYLDGGPTAGSTASSIVDFAHGSAREIRRGTIDLEQLSAAANTPILPAEVAGQ